jgi:hypothetical protein
VEIGGCTAIIIDASAGADMTVWVALQAVYRSAVRLAKSTAIQPGG